MVRTLAEAAVQNKTPQVICKENLKKASRFLPKRQFELAVGTGGNLDAIGKLKLTLLKKGPNTLVSASELKIIYKRFMKMSPQDRLTKLDLKPDRLDVIEPALFLTLQLLKKYKIKRIKIPCVGLKEGAIYSLLNSHS